MLKHSPIPIERGLEMKLLDNLFCYIWSGRGNNCNSYLFAHVLRGNRPHVLIDPGHVVNELNERCLEQLLSSIQRDGLEPEDIGLIIDTHSHIDHCEANQAIVERSRMKGGTGEIKQAMLTLHKADDEFRRTLGRKMAAILGREVEFEPDFYLQEGELNLGEDNKLRFQVLHTPGHSPGSVCLYCPDSKVLITGDVVFYGSIGRADLPGADGKLLKQSIGKLSELDADYLLPGHSTEYGAIIKGRDKVSKNFELIRSFFFPML